MVTNFFALNPRLRTTGEAPCLGSVYRAILMVNER